MIRDVLEYLSVYAISMFKFVFGPVFGKLYGISFIVTALLTSAGMMTSVFLFSSIFGKKIHTWIMKTFFKERKLFSSRTRKIVKIWRRYGLAGVAFLTPILFTPIGGTLVATSFGEHRNKIFKYMLVSALFWAFLFSYGFDIFKLDTVWETLTKSLR